MTTIFRTCAATLAITALMAACAAVTAPTATAQADGSGSLSQLVTGLVTTGSGPALLTGSNDAAATTGSSDLAGALLCGLLAMSSAGGPSICDTGIVG
ncbi:hypothetical protein ACFWUP_05650 [Nocardia sp. NPDC058658]|uniref:hypothetical protein n=1 Tax=Nocardia sp. NPDC058658 TaxID=3346580 RepID=UPI00366014BD